MVKITQRVCVAKVIKNWWQAASQRHETSAAVVDSHAHTALLQIPSAVPHQATEK